MIIRIDLRSESVTAQNKSLFPNRDSFSIIQYLSLARLLQIMAHHSQTPGTNSFRLNNHSGHIESGQPWSNSTPTMSNQALSQSANSRPATPADLYATYTAPRANLGWQPHAAMTHLYACAHILMRPLIAIIAIKHHRHSTPI